MWSFSALCDEFCVTSRLLLKLQLEPSRETVLHFFEQTRRAFPRLMRLRRRDDGSLLLDEDAADGARRFVRLDSDALRFGIYQAESAADVSAFAARVLDAAPAQLSLSEIDYDYFETVFSFDLEFRGNHDDLIAETFFANHPLMRVVQTEDAGIIECQPAFGVALGDLCDQQLYLELRGRTSTYEVRTGEYENAPLTVSLTARRYWSAECRDLVTVHNEQLAIAARVCEERVLPQVVQPLAAAIASRR